jgi:hypothetical protein
MKKQRCFTEPEFYRFFEGVNQVVLRSAQPMAEESEVVSNIQECEGDGKETSKDEIEEDFLLVYRD